MTENKSGEKLREENVDRGGLAKLLEALGQIPQSGIDALLEKGLVSEVPPTTEPPRLRPQRLGYNVVTLL